MGSRDLISNLPDEVLGKILSLLSTNRAACTSVLSRRWRNLLALVDNLDFKDESGGDNEYFCDFVDRALALLSNSTTVKRFSLNCHFKHDTARVNTWIRTVLQRGFLELHLEAAINHYIDTELFTSNQLVKLTISGAFNPLYWGRLPPGGVFFPALKSLFLVSVEFFEVEFYQELISGCPLLEELFLHYDSPNRSPVVVSSPSIKRLNIDHHHLHDQNPEEPYNSCWFRTPNLVYLDYSSYVANYYVVDLPSLEEARLDLRSWEQLTEEDADTDDSDEDSDTEEDIFGHVNHLIAGISNVKTLHLSSDTLEVFHLRCDTMPVFRNLLTLSFESDKDIGWQVVPLLLNHSPNLETLVIKGLVHQVTDMCGDACACIPRRTKKKMKMDEGVCCLSTCQVKVLNISGYRGTCRELKHMRHFLANLKCLETVKVCVKVSRGKENDADNKYLRIIDALRKLPRVSSNCQIHFF